MQKKIAAQSKCRVNRSNQNKGYCSDSNLLELGISSIGENRIQEAEKKLKELPSFNSIKKRFIGHLQTNKVNKCLRLFDTIDSVDTLKLAEKINSSSQPKKQNALLK